MFLDTSVVVAYYLGESYSEQVEGIYRQNLELYLSELVELDVFSAFSRLVRVGSLPVDAAHWTAALFSEHLDAGLYERLHLHAGYCR